MENSGNARRNDLFRDANGNYRGYDLLSAIATIRPYQTKL